MPEVMSPKKRQSINIILYKTNKNIEIDWSDSNTGVLQWALEAPNLSKAISIEVLQQHCGRVSKVDQFRFI